MIKPEKQFYIFGMGARQKYVYKAGGTLTKFETNEVVYSFDVKNEKFLFDRYTVVIWTNDNKRYLIKENSYGAYVCDITDGEEKTVLTLCESEYINLPDFEEYKYPEQLRILHQEILVSFLGDLPVPNIYTYKKPWYRDAAMMALALEKTNNLHLMKNWALGVSELYDKNNKGNCEPDNLGQLAFVLSYFVDKDYPLIKEIYKEAERIAENGLLTGLTDYSHHEIYATLWLKLAFDRLGIEADFIKIPKEFDRYARMFWMDRSEVELDTPFDNEYDALYPYLTWATYHFNGDEIPSELLEIKYPMSWEIRASEASYDLIAPLSEEYAKERCSAPHSWHASEMFTYLIEKPKVKNVVFDCGQVLVHFEPSYMVGVYVSDKNDKALLEEVIFDRLYWDKLDLGTITNEETVSEIKKRIPERLWEVSEKIYYNWIYNIPEIEGMKELISNVKERHGVKVFLLSNISKYFAAHIGELEILKGFDGLVMSSEIGIVKPSNEIYDYLCKTYSLNPSQTVFIDDRRENVEGAIRYGIGGYLFDGNVNKLSEYLETIL